jgi:hypothetical protein
MRRKAELMERLEAERKAKEEKEREAKEEADAKQQHEDDLANVDNITDAIEGGEDAQGTGEALLLWCFEDLCC